MDSVTNIPDRVRAYFELLDVPYAVMLHERTGSPEAAAHAGGVHPHHLARAVVLHDKLGIVMAVLAVGRELDLKALAAEMGRPLRPVPEDALRRLFPECHPNAIPPVGTPFSIDAVLDQSLESLDEVYFEAGNHDCLVRVSGDAFRLLHTASWRGDFSRPSIKQTTGRIGALELPADIAARIGPNGLLPTDDLKLRLQQLRTLPAMPDMATKLLQLRNDPRATIPALTAIVENDPSLAAQIVRYARSAFFGYRGKVETIQEAITRVLGFDTTVNIALGFAVGRAFRTPAGGTLGLNAFWRHAVYSAALCQTLAGRLPQGMRVKPGLAYLAGLLHNFGFLITGHLFPREFEMLDRVVEANPDVPVPFIEKRVLGIEHTQVGAWLMEAWGMPDAVTVSVREHHDEVYGGEQAVYANLVLVADHLLKAEGMGDGASDAPPPAMLNALGLDRDSARELVVRVLEGGEGLEQMARQLAA